MRNREAVMALSQSEKVKAGLIWISSVLQMAEGFEGAEKRGAERSSAAFLDMVVHDLELAEKMAPDPGWKDVGVHLDRAVAMVNSGVGSEAVYHITKALSRVTTIGQRAMTSLKDEGLL